MPGRMLRPRVNNPILNRKLTTASENYRWARAVLGKSLGPVAKAALGKLTTDFGIVCDCRRHSDR